MATTPEKKVKRKKTSRACIHCQRAHLTCDDSRPCQRCIKRDLAATCMDGVRKKAKYLQDTDPTPAPSMGSNSSSGIDLQSDLTAPLHQLDQASSQDLLNGSYLDASSFFGLNPLSADNFGSQAVNLEYSILSSMFSNPLGDTNALAMLNPSQWTTDQTTSAASATAVENGGGLVGSGYELRKRKGYSPENVYASIKAPHNYVEGFHYLVKYMKDKMEKEDMMRITRAISGFRPSFITLVMNLTLEDLIFMEKMFQRTLLEFEKLVSFSGTPTVVWRRTGEIALVGKEFLLLTQWTREQILGKKTYIYELMDNQSAVEYWEKFSVHAFETESSVMTTCVLLTPAGRRVPCGFCFTIKRDIFDIPLTIVGNFLPILI
ncbi:uncharacterized protein VTP21DRAFT_4394 [Calcarisporiella thermophila]|uniref:uncharacterized protein n=1 Tax=Calcarisporiella thermophila TaxID=911321 RepID=UPI0037426E7C